MLHLLVSYGDAKVEKVSDAKVEKVSVGVGATMGDLRRAIWR